MSHRTRPYTTAQCLAVLRPRARMLPIAVVLACLLAGSASAGNLRIFEALAPGQGTRTLAGPLTNFLIDVDYAPSSAEGGKLYGLAEIQIEATGNLVLTPTGFACQAAPCLYVPSPFVAGKKIRLTAGNDLAGETAATANFFTVGLTGSVGHVVVSRGDYLDGSRPGGASGSPQTVDAKILVTVPEPRFATALAATGALLAALARRRARRAPITRA